MNNQLAKLLPLIAIAIATPSFAASDYFTPNSHHAQIADGRMGKHADNLNLTAAQKTKIEQLKTATRSQIEAVLTPAQRQKFAQLKAQHQANRDRRQARVNAWNSLNLTADQKAKIDTIRQSSKQQFNTILTPEQQSQRKSHHHRHSGRHHSA
jgi:periplasmic protein CpxP/Spy